MEEGGVRSVESLAAELGLSARSVYSLLNKGLRDACKAADGTYDLQAAAEWLEEHKKGAKKDPLAKLRKKELSVKIAGRIEDNELKRFKRELAAGRWVDRDDVLQDFSDLLGYAKPLIDELPDTIAKEVPAEVRIQVLQLVTNACERFFHQICNWEPKGVHPAGGTA